MRACALRRAGPRLRLVGATAVWDRGRPSGRACTCAALPIQIAPAGRLVSLSAGNDRTRTQWHRPLGARTGMTSVNREELRRTTRSPSSIPVPQRTPDVGMRILVLHSRYLSGSLSGENRVVDDEIELLRRAGHDVFSWTPSVPEEQPWQTATNAIWSRKEASNVRRLIARNEPEVVHVHNLFPRLSPSVIGAAATTGIPVLVTLHNFRLMCLPATFLRDGRLCEACAGHVPWRGVAHGCYRDSRPASAALASSLTLHRATQTFGKVTLFLAVSDFVRRKHVQYGFDSGRIRVKTQLLVAATATPRAGSRLPHSRTAVSGEGHRHGHRGCC